MNEGRAGASSGGNPLQLGALTHEELTFIAVHLNAPERALVSHTEQHTELMSALSWHACGFELSSLRIGCSASHVFLSPRNIPNHRVSCGVICDFSP